MLDEEEAKLILEDYDDDLQSDGTLIIWDNCDRLTDEISQKEFNEKLWRLESAGSHFHQFLLKQ